eukprot:TRINITY_DN85034_c0_g1_i1.p2 TRINITY_DN85034_c0_g1~~TRINITY_DN85034_c0_g1_i1.p2  ORF type:complete len:246 (+),score=39.16 TRINITY_DN85034_c0_g1_i1:75-740(+)
MNEASQQTAGYSTYLIIDRSGGMGCEDTKPAFPQIINFGGLNNRIGVIYEAAIKYVKLRALYSPDDIVTFVPFNHEASVVFQGLSVTKQQEIINFMLPYGPNGGASFVAGFQAAYNALQFERQQNTGQIPRKPVFIFLTCCEAADQLEAVTFLEKVMDQEIGRGPSSLCVHALGIEGGSDLKFLTKIAEIGNGSVYQFNRENDFMMGLDDLARDVFEALAK